ncbi:MAG: radical SAM protein [Candidatus Omnitrophica bacterium]|nr:radical SAM protein [Candidatus Omnitrophota bacterium]
MQLEELEGYQGIKKFAEVKGVMIMITSGCDCLCQHCGIALYKSKEREELSTIEIKERILDRLSDIGFKMVCLFGGEPTLHKDFLELLQYATKKGLYTRFDTNGHKLADIDFAKEIKDAGITFLLVSIDSADAETHDRFRGFKGSWSKAIQAIRNCVKLGIPVGISTVVTKQSLKKGDFKKIIQLGKDLGVFKIRALTPIMIGRWYQQDIKLSEEEKKEFFSLLEPNFVFWEEWCDGTVPFVCCSITRWFFFISLYGDVQPCCYIPLSFGNVRNENLKDIVERMWSTSYFSIERANINRCDCPMNDSYIRERLKKMFEKTKVFPVEYDEKIFNSKG